MYELNFLLRNPPKWSKKTFLNILTKKDCMSVNIGQKKPLMVHFKIDRKTTIPAIKSFIFLHAAVKLQRMG